MAKRASGPELTWEQRRQALGYIPGFLRLVWQTNPRSTVAMILLRLVRAFVPLSSLWVGKLIIDAVVRARRAGPDFPHLWKLVALEFGIVLAGEGLARASALIESLLGDQFSNVLSVRLMEHAARLDLYHFEDPKFYDQLERARRQTSSRIALLNMLLSMSQNFITLISLSTALLVFSPLLFLLLVITVIPGFLGETHFASLEYSLFYRWTPERRQLDYLRYAGASDETAKEVQMFGLAPWLISRFRRLSQQFFDENKKLSIRKAFVSFGLSILGTLGYYI